jgi:NADPH-dependent 2,4-dienoyl-CoA reductase/sulfur reductase-like enzyme
VQVVQVVPGDGILPEILPPYLSQYALKKHQDRKGLTVLNGSDVTRITANEAGDKATVELEDGNKVEVDHVVIIPTLVPNITFSGPLEADATGLIANRELQIATNLFTVSRKTPSFRPLSHFHVGRGVC